MSQKILLVDGHSIANRAFFGLPPMSYNGIPTGAILGFFNILFRTIDDEKPDQLAIAFDLNKPTFRHKMFEDYKGTRSPMLPELREQIPRIRKMLEEAGCAIVTKEGYEADDVLGTLAKKHGADGDSVVILSGDRDLLQLVDDQVTVRLPKTKKNGSEVEIYRPEDVQEAYGVTPDGFLQMKALMGDASDNIPGIPSIGEKTAAKIVQTYGTLEEAIANADQVKPPRAGRNLKEFADQGRLSLKLATIETHVPDLADTQPILPQTFHTEAFKESLKQYGLSQLLKRIIDEDQTQAAVKGPSDKPNTEQGILEDCRQLAQKLDPLPQKLSVVFLQDEEDSPVLGAAVACQRGAWFVEAGQDQIIDTLSSAFASQQVDKIFFDCKGLIKALLQKDLPLHGFVLDAMLAHYLLDATLGNYSVEGIGSAFLHRYVKTQDEIRGTGAKRISWMAVGEQEKASYMLECAKVLLDAEPVLVGQLKQEGMMDLYSNIEYPLTEVLSSMELEGIRVDVSVLKEIGEFLKKEIAKTQEEIYTLAGEAFNIHSPRQLGTILFEKLGFPAGKKTKSGYSTSAEELENLLAYDESRPIVSAVLKYRQLTKLESTYVEGLQNFIGPDGNIHCRFQQAVTATGRLSCTDPNLQNIPIRDELGRTLRKAFVPSDSDHLFMDADYSQIELRLVAHMSGDENMIDAYRHGADIHRLTASQVLHKPYEEVTDLERSRAKAVNFGIIYGISAFGLAKDIGIGRQEAADYIENYYLRFPGVKQFMDNCVALAKERGYAETLFGRRRRIDELKASRAQLRSFGERVAKNMPIQGTAADIIKIAMIRVYHRLKKEGLKSKVIVQVHDELLLEVYRPEEAQVAVILKEEMEGAASLKVPLTVDVKTGEDWYQAK